jgi:hypothetical protein
METESRTMEWCATSVRTRRTANEVRGPRIPGVTVHLLGHFDTQNMRCAHRCRTTGSYPDT